MLFVQFFFAVEQIGDFSRTAIRTIANNDHRPKLGRKERGGAGKTDNSVVCVVIPLTNVIKTLIWEKFTTIQESRLA